VSTAGLVALGGALGALARYGLGTAAVRAFGTTVPVGTWAVNLLGCFLIGLALPVAAADRARLVLIVGFLGSFTTFSTFSADTLALLEAGRPGLALLNAAGSLLGGLALTALGMAVGRALAP
jgi:CrcB protein